MTELIGISKARANPGIKYPLSFYQRDTVQVAKELLGQQLVHRIGRHRLAGIIVETEAYTGTEDAACHAFGGRHTPRNTSLYLEGGHAYVYFIYGMHFCINVVTKEAGCPEAVLIRALEPTEGLAQMMKHRGSRAFASKIQNLTNGPGKLCAALHVHRKHDGLRLDGNEVFIEDVGIRLKPKQIVKAPRIGVDYAGDAAQWHLRFYIKHNSFVSRI